MKNPLDFIFSSVSRSEFFDHYEQNKPLVVHGLNSKLGELFELPFLNSIEELFNIWPVEVNAYLPGLSDEANSTKVSVEQARDFFEDGHGLFFDGPHNMAPVIQDWMEGFKNDLGLPSITFAQSIIYAIAKGKGTDPHFDQNINFVLQVSGQKKWWTAKNEYVDSPTSRHTIGTPMNSELSNYADKEMPLEFPKDTQEYLLKPGSMLFLPQGVWHKTEALEDSLSLNFTYSPPSWLDLLTMALRSELSKESKWRETSNYICDSKNRDKAISKFEVLTKELSQNKEFWQAENIVKIIEGFEESP